MNCEHQQEKVSLFIDGELESQEQSLLFGHLAECPECKAFFEITLKIKDAGRSDALLYPQDLDSRILEDLASRHSDKKGRVTLRSRWSLLWKSRVDVPVPIALASIVIVVLLSMLLIDLMNGSLRGRDDTRQASVTDSEVRLRPSPVVFVYGIPEVNVYGHKIFNK